MKFRFKAFGLHLLGSAAVLSLVLGGLYLGWYRWPGWYLTDALHILVIVLVTDLVVGPTLTFLVANPAKPRRVFARDVGVILVVQLTALSYGATTLWLGRPIYYAFSVDCLQIVQASDITANEVILAQQQNPSLAPHWYSLPRWVWAPLPANPEEAAKIVGEVTLGGADVVEMPRFFHPWIRGLDQMRGELATIDKVWGLSNSERVRLRKQIEGLGESPDKRNTLLVWGPRRALAVFDPATLQLRAILRPG